MRTAAAAAYKQLSLCVAGIVSPSQEEQARPLKSVLKKPLSASSSYNSAPPDLLDGGGDVLFASRHVR